MSIWCLVREPCLALTAADPALAAEVHGRGSDNPRTANATEALPHGSCTVPTGNTSPGSTTQTVASEVDLWSLTSTMAA